MDFGKDPHELLDQLKLKAKRLAKRDKTRSHVQWLNYLAQQHGAHTFKLLQTHLAELERKANAAAEDLLWQKRLSDSLCWGTLGPIGPNNIMETGGLPIAEKSHLPWPHCFIDSPLFTPREGPRRQIAGKVFSVKGSPEVFFKGEELRVGDDQTVLMAIMKHSGCTPCGRVLEFSVSDLEVAMGLKLHELGIPIEVADITRSLWRFTHGELKVDQFEFCGPILVFADVRQAPDKFRVRFNPNFANFFSPVLDLSGVFRKLFPGMT